MKQEEFSRTAAVLENSGIADYWSHDTELKKIPEIPEAPGNVCMGCGKPIRDGFLHRLPQYCSECMASRNNADDYLEIMRMVTGWMENLIKLDHEYMIRIRRIYLRYGREPVRIRRGILLKPYISVRRSVKRKYLPVHMVHAYLSLWMKEYTGERMNRESCRDFLKSKDINSGKDCEVVIYWYMLCYLYNCGEGGRAERLHAIVNRNPRVKEGLRKLIEDEEFYPYQLPDEGNRDYIDRLLNKHPIKCLMSES